MKKLLVILAFIICLLLSKYKIEKPIATQTPMPTTHGTEKLFMPADWVVFGMGKSEIMSHYKISPEPHLLEGGRMIAYYFDYKNYDNMYIRYRIDYNITYDEGKLYKVYFYVDFNPSSEGYDVYMKKPIIEEYNYIKSYLTAEIGKPTFEYIDWKDNTYRNDPSKLAYALVTGQCTYQTRWYYKNYFVWLYTGGSRICIEYSSKDQQ